MVTLVALTPIAGEAVLPLARLKQHVKEETDEQDALLTIYRDAAVRSIQHHTGVNLSAIVDVGTIMPNLVAAVALLASHLFRNREAVVIGVPVAILPMGVEALCAGDKLTGIR